MKVLYFVVGYQTSCSAWRTLKQALASTSNSCIMQLHSSLQDLWQGDESVTQFMQKDKGLFDELVAVGRPISLKDFNLYVFRGLRGEFKDLITSFVINVEPLSYADLHSHFSRMNLFTNRPIHPWGLLPSMLLCCPRPTHLLLLCFSTPFFWELWSK